MCCATPQGGGGSTTHWTINTSPVSNWFPSDLFANANLLFMFLFLFTLYSHHEFNGCPWAAVAPSLLSLASFSQRAEVWTCFFFYSSTPYYSPLRTHSRVILLPFSCSTFTWLPFSASRFSLSAFCSFRYVFFSVSVRFFLSFFRYPAKHTIIISILMLQ